MARLGRLSALDFSKRLLRLRNRCSAARARGQAFRPQIENLEGRTVPSTVNWINPAGGNWSVASNWDTGAVPGPSDDVVINMPGDYTVMHIAGTDAVHSITSQHPLVLYSGGSIDLAATSNFSDLRISGGTLSGNGNIIVHGDFEWTAGTISGTPGSSHSWIAAEGQLHISEFPEKTLDSRDLDNYGWATLEGGPLTLRHANFDNHINATLDTLVGATIQDAAAYDGEFINGGLVRVFSSLSLNTYIVTNRGAIDVNGGWLTDSDTLSRVVNVGEIVLRDPNGGLNLQTDVYQQQDGLPVVTGSITGSGSIVMRPVALLAGAFSIDGDASFNGGLLSNLSHLHVGGALSVAGGSVSGMVEAASLTVGGTGNILLSFNNTVFAIAGEVDIEPYSALVVGSLAQFPCQLQAGRVINDGSIFLNANSTIQVSTGLYNRGTMTGDGTVQGDLINEGELTVGVAFVTGQLTVTGNFVQTAEGTLTVRIGSSNPDSPNDLLVVGGMAILDGTLTVRMMNGYQPNNSDSFQFLSSAGIAGDFAAFTMPDLGTGFYLTPSNDGTTYSLNVQQDP